MQKLKAYKLKGIGFSPFEFRIDSFHGCYIRLITFYITYKKGKCLINRGSENSFFYIGVHDRENNSTLFVLRLFFGILIRFYIRPQKFIGCKECKTKVEKDLWDENCFWCPECKKWINFESTETITSRKI